MNPARMHPPARERPPRVAPTFGPYLSWIVPPGIMNRAKIHPHVAYAQVAWASVRYNQPAFSPVMALPAGWAGLAIRLAFQTLQA